MHVQKGKQREHRDLRSEFLVDSGNAAHHRCVRLFRMEKPTTNLIQKIREETVCSSLLSVRGPQMEFNINENEHNFFCRWIPKYLLFCSFYLLSECSSLCSNLATFLGSSQQHEKVQKNIPPFEVE